MPTVKGAAESALEGKAVPKVPVEEGALHALDLSSLMTGCVAGMRQLH